MAEIPPEITSYLDDRESELGIHFSDCKESGTRRRKTRRDSTCGGSFRPRSRNASARRSRARSTPTALTDFATRSAFGKSARTSGRSYIRVGIWVRRRNMVTWFFQILPDGTYRFIDCMAELDITPAERVARIYARGWPMGKHYLPHDAEATQKSGKTFYAELLELGMTNVKIIPRTKDIWMGINYDALDLRPIRVPAPAMRTGSRSALLLPQAGDDRDRICGRGTSS